MSLLFKFTNLFVGSRFFSYLALVTFAPSSFSSFAVTSFVVTLVLDRVGVESRLGRYAGTASEACTVPSMDEVGCSDHAAGDTVQIVGPMSLSSTNAAFATSAMAHGLLRGSSGRVMVKKDCFRSSQLPAAARYTCSC